MQCRCLQTSTKTPRWLRDRHRPFSESAIHNFTTTWGECVDRNWGAKCVSHFRLLHYFSIQSHTISHHVIKKTAILWVKNDPRHISASPMVSCNFGLQNPKAEPFERVSAASPCGTPAGCGETVSNNMLYFWDRNFLEFPLLSTKMQVHNS